MVSGAIISHHDHSKNDVSAQAIIRAGERLHSGYHPLPSPTLVFHFRRLHDGHITARLLESPLSKGVEIADRMPAGSSIQPHHGTPTTRRADAAPIPRETILPAKIGQTLNDRYRILAKLGYGAYSTVWLTRDQRTDQYSSIKICVRDESKASPVANEVSLLRHMATCSTDHTGAELTRLADEIFHVDGHSCIAMKPHACSLQQLQHMLVGSKVQRQFMSAVVVRLLLCVNRLQLECGVAHTGMFASLRFSEEALKSQGQI